MEDMMSLLDKEIKRSDDLLTQMIPKATADHLRNGGSLNSICKVTCILRNIIFSKLMFTDKFY